MRLESDSMGSISVPSNRYWGAQTERSILNFPIGRSRFQWGAPMIRAMGILKKAAALANAASGVPPLLGAGALGALMLYLYWVGVQRKLQAREGRMQLASIVDQSPDAIVGLDNDGVVTSWNSGAQRLFGHTRERALLLNRQQQCQVLHAQAGQETVEALLAGRGFHG